jgi:hypothetical protein
MKRSKARAFPFPFVLFLFLSCRCSRTTSPSSDHAVTVRDVPFSDTIFTFPSHTHSCQCVSGTRTTRSPFHFPVKLLPLDFITSLRYSVLTKLEQDSRRLLPLCVNKPSLQLIQEDRQKKNSTFFFVFSCPSYVLLSRLLPRRLSLRLCQARRGVTAVHRIQVATAVLPAARLVLCVSQFLLVSSLHSLSLLS